MLRHGDSSPPPRREEGEGAFAVVEADTTDAMLEPVTPQDILDLGRARLAGPGAPTQAPPALPEPPAGAVNPGDEVQLHGLASKNGTKLNGAVGIVLPRARWGNGRVAVKVRGGAAQSELSMRAANLRVTRTGAAKQPAAALPENREEVAADMPSEIKQDSDLAAGMCVGTFRWKSSKSLPTLPADAPAKGGRVNRLRPPAF